MSKVGIIIAREFNERVRKKSFIITTILMPVLMIGLMIVPALIMNYSRGDTKRIAVIDESGLVLPALESDEVLVFEPTQLSVTEARTQLPDAFGVLWIGKDVLGNPSEVKLYANTSSSMLVESGIESQISRILEREKLKAYAIDDLPRILEAVKTPVHLQVFRNDEGGQDRHLVGGRHGARFHPLYVPAHLRGHGHAERHRGEKQPRTRSGRFLDPAVSAHDG